MMWNDVRHFRSHEFDSPDAPGSGIHMDLNFVLRLDHLRSQVGFPLIVQSGYRTPAHNKKVGGVDSSSHEMGYAADIRAADSQVRFRVLEEALAMGFRRIGLGASFIHLDEDPTKPQDVLWLYKSKETQV